MRLDAKGVVRFLNKNTGDGSEVSLGTTCCDDFSTNFPFLLGSLFDGKLAFIDVDSDGDGNIDTYSGIKAIFIDVNGNNVIETPLDGSNGKVDIIDTGYSKILRFKGSVTGSDSSPVYISNVAFVAVAISTSDMKTPNSISLGISDAPSKSTLAQIEPTTNKKGIPVTLSETNFEFELSIELR